MPRGYRFWEVSNTTSPFARGRKLLPAAALAAALLAGGRPGLAGGAGLSAGEPRAGPGLPPPADGPSRIRAAPAPGRLPAGLRRGRLASGESAFLAPGQAALLRA